jgi:hypothetical protein
LTAQTPRDLGRYEPPQEPPIDLGQIGIVEANSYRMDGDAIDFRWTNAARSETHSFTELRASTVVLLSRTSFSGEGKLTLLAVEQYLSEASAAERDRIVVVVITLNEDPARAAIGRPSVTFRPLVAFADATGAEAPAFLRFSAVPVAWFVGPDGVVRQRIEGRAATRDDIARAIAAAR